MKTSDKTNNGFFLREHFVTDVKDVLTPEQFKDYCTALVEAGLRHEYTITDPIVRALLIDKVVSMNSTDRNYRRCQIYGSWGGRRKILKKSDLQYAVCSLEITTIKGLAEHFNCSTRTVNRYIKSEEIREMIRNKREREGIR